MPARSVHASKMSRLSSGPRLAKWSMFQQWSKPESSATRQIVIRVSRVAA
jgi:hypothetical protein